MAALIQANEAVAARRRVRFHLVGPNGTTPITGEAGGQPQISSDDGAWTDGGIGPLVEIGNGRYYAVLTQAAVLTAGTYISTRYKSGNTAECPGESVSVVDYDPTSLGADILTLKGNAAVVDAMVAMLAQNIVGTVDGSSGLPTKTTEFEASGAWGAFADGSLRGRAIQWQTGALTGSMQRITNFRAVNAVWRFTIEPAITPPAVGATFRLI